LTSTTRINDGAFHHIALVRSTIQKADQSQEATLTLYIDGVASGTKADTTQNAAAAAPIVLASRAGTADFFTGVIDESLKPHRR
jgi:Concanavalin A-like lectin/glucanases superfamily